MKVQILPWLCLITFMLVACHSVKGEASADTKVKAGERDEEQHIGRRGVEGVVHERKGGAYGGSDINKKPPKNKNGATDVPVKALGGITFCVFMVVNCFFLML